MPRILFATLIGLIGFLLYVVAVVTLADEVPPQPLVQICYFAVVGFIWVFPVRWLMLWAARKL